jgi:menaquinone-9 beta-reductase
MRSRVDAVVVGGGPAGAFSALQLARLGWSVMLVERGERNREKTCGHCVNARALRTLQQHGLLDRVNAIALGSSTHLIVQMPCIGSGLQSRLPENGLVVPRSAFDQLLREAAAETGASVTHSASARLVEWNDHVAEIEITSDRGRSRVGCGLVIGADGLGSDIARAAGLVKNRSIGRKFGFSFDFEPAASIMNRQSAIQMFMGPGGYLGAVAHGDRLHVAGLVSSSVARAHREPLAFVRLVAKQHEWLVAVELDRITHDRVKHLTATGPIPWRAAAIANQRVALVGDAAGFVEPFTGEGISWALLSAQTLGDTLAQGPIGAWDERAARQYMRAWSVRVGRKQRLCQLLSPMLSRPRISTFMFRFGRRLKPVTRHLMKRAVTA